MLTFNKFNIQHRTFVIIIFIVAAIFTGISSVVVGQSLDKKEKRADNIATAASGCSFYSNYWECSTVGDPGRYCNGAGTPSEGKMASCIDAGWTAYCGECNTNEKNYIAICGGNFCYYNTRDLCQSNCGCDVNACRTKCQNAYSGNPGYHTYTDICSNCGQEFTCGCNISNPPTSTPIPQTLPTASISINATNPACTSGWSGRLEDNGSQNPLENRFNQTNNPLTFTTQFSDINGINTISYMNVWYSTSSNFATTPKIGTSFRRSGGGLEYSIGSGWTSIPVTTSANTAAICTMTSGAQESCSVDADAVPYGTSNDVNVVGYIKPIVKTDTSNTTSIIWKIGIKAIGSGYFSSPSLSLYAQGFDTVLSPSASNRATRSWRYDYDLPTNVTITADPTSSGGNLVYRVNYTSSDATSGVMSANPRVVESGLSTGEGFRVTSSGFTHDFSDVVDDVPGDNNGNERYPFFSDYKNPLNNPVSYTFSNINITDANLSVQLEVQDLACNLTISSPAILYIRLPWLMTTGGTVYTDQIDENIPTDQPIDKVSSTMPFRDMEPNASTYAYIYQNTDAGVNRESFNNYKFSEYTDLNFEPRQNAVGRTWVAYIKDSLAKSVNKGDAGYQPDYGDLSIAGLVTESLWERDGDNINETVINVITVNGTLTINSGSICDMRTVFIANNLVINPDFTNLDNNNGCVFIVEDTTTINMGVDKLSTDTHTDYDFVDGLIITNKINIINDTVGQDGLMIKGALITDANDPAISETTFVDNKNTQFLRELMVVSSLSSPSEVIVYDGTRYIYLFDDLLFYPPKYSIREKQFTNINSYTY